jgi:hypothetical protein
MLLGVLYLIPDEADPYGIVAHLVATSASSSYLMISHPASEVHAEQAAAGARRYGKMMGLAQANRSHADVSRFFGGLDLLEPGVVQANRWRPAPGDDVETELSNWCGLARKP